VRFAKRSQTLVVESGGNTILENGGGPGAISNAFAWDQWQLKWASASAVELVTLALPRPALGTIDHGKGKLINFCFSGWCPALEHDHKLFPRPLNATV
jgi:hypothetical protein